MFDMGPYYLTALVSLLGPVARVSGSARASFSERTIGSAPKKGQKIKVEVPTHVTGLLDFANGALVTMITSFDVWGHTLPHLEIYGSGGHVERTGPKYLRRAGAALARGWQRLGRYPAHPRIRAQQPRPGCSRYGRRPPIRTPPPGQCRPGLPRPGYHAGHPQFCRRKAGRSIFPARVSDLQLSWGFPSPFMRDKTGM